jgi:hypothetical protein
MSDCTDDRAVFQAFTSAFEPKRINSVGDENSETPHCRRRVSVHAFGSCHIHGLNGTMMIIALKFFGCAKKLRPLDSRPHLLHA